MAQTIETPVLIVGAGPVGLQLALDLAWRGIACTIIDQNDGSPQLHPRAAAIAVRTMEFCRRWGIADKVVHAGFPLDYEMNIVYCTALNGKSIARENYPSAGDQPALPYSPENKQRCPQIWFDPLLADALKRYPHADLRFGVRLETFEQRNGQVRARTIDESSGETIDIQARYMVGCDGAASDVRRALGIEVEGNPALSYSVNVVFRVKDLSRFHDKGQAERYLFIGPSGTWANMTVIDGGELWRFTLVGSEEKMDLAGLDIESFIRQAFGRDDVPIEIRAVAPWRRSSLIAERYRAGNVFLAGDAAHTMSPTGGMGMNTGAGDAVDLAWKLEAVLRDWGGDGLLDTYELERRPVAIRNAQWSSGNFKTWLSAGDCARILDDTPEGDRIRDQVGEHLRASLRTEWESWGIQLGYRYDDSPICIADGSAIVPDDVSRYVQNARPGSRAPHAWLSDGRSTLDLFGRGFVLLRFPSGHKADTSLLEDAARARAVPLTIVDIDSAEIAALYAAPWVLVRPDGHVAWRGAVLPRNPYAWIDIVRGCTTDATAEANSAHGLTESIDRA